MHVEQEVTGDDTPVLQCVLNADAELSALMREEAELSALMDAHVDDAVDDSTGKPPRCAHLLLTLLCAHTNSCEIPLTHFAECVTSRLVRDRKQHSHS